jgi:outer membrane immunogenic protein
MKKLAVCLIFGLAGFAAATAAHSADLPKLVVKAPPAARPADWTGFYFGVQGGAGWGRAHQSDSFPFDSGSYNLSGGLAGVTWGYNWQVGNTVVGFESDAAWSNIHGSTDGANGLNGLCGGAPSHCEATLQAFGTSRLRLGYAFDRWMPFVTGGMAWGYVHGKEGDTIANGAAGSGSEFHSGWTVGAGVEAMIDPHWSAKVEYLYADLRGGLTFVDQFTGGGAVDEAEGMRVHIVRAGLNYKFDPGNSLLPFLPPNPGPSAGPWNWAGLYVGVNYGGGAGKASQSDAVFDRGTYDVSGTIAGGTIGYNWQKDRVIYGLEGDLDYSSIKGATSGPYDVTLPFCGVAGFSANCDTRLQWLGTARARIGVAWDRLLPYATAGVAVGSLKSSEGAPPVVPLYGSGTVTRVGWTAGAGIEARIDNRWSAKLEYLYVDLGGGQGFTDNLAGGGTIAENVTFTTHILRSGLNYRFD